MKFVIFIGHHKVGSSALQDFLSRNALALLKAGVLYPMVESVGHAHMLHSALMGSDPVMPLPINAREAHNALAFRMLSEARGKNQVPAFHRNIPASRQMFAAIRNQIEVLQPETVVLCAEVFSNFGAVEPALIDRLGKLVGAAELRVICTLRRPDEYVASWQGQRLKFGHVPPALREVGVADYADTIHFDYALMLRAWLERLPQADFRFRNYRDVLKAGGSVEDFLAQADIAVPAGLQAVGAANPSIPFALMEIARRANAALPGRAARQFRDHLMARRDTLDLPGNAEVELFGAAHRADLLDRFAPVAAFLEETVGPGAFFPDLEAAREVRPTPELDAARAALDQLRSRAAPALPAELELPADTTAFLESLRLS